MPIVFVFLLAFFISLVLTVTFTRILLPFLRRYHIGQQILEIGPAWHRQKEGTPTMGGLAFVAATGITLFLGWALLSTSLPELLLRPLILTVLYAMGNAIIGSVDDLTKFRRSQNEGLTPPQKLLLQVTLAAAYIALLHLYGYIDTSFYIPYIDLVIDVGYAYYPLALLLAVGVVNFVNLTDGIDGLAASTTLVFAAFFAVAAAFLSEPPALLVATAMMGACLGFLFFNRHPAKLFMGDTGSLFLGGMAVGCAFLIDNPLLVLVAGGVFVWEGISVVLQVIYFKLTGKRLFRMAPFHHHLERCGWSENQIVLLFVAFGLLFALVAAGGLGR